MPTRNVGPLDAALRCVFAAVLTLAGVVLIVDGSAWGLVVAPVCWVAAILLLKSVFTRHCPVHEQAGIDTTR